MEVYVIVDIRDVPFGCVRAGNGYQHAEAIASRHRDGQGRPLFVRMGRVVKPQGLRLLAVKAPKLAELELPVTVPSAPSGTGRTAKCRKPLAGQNRRSRCSPTADESVMAFLAAGLGESFCDSAKVAPHVVHFDRLTGLVDYHTPEKTTLALRVTRTPKGKKVIAPVADMPLAEGAIVRRPRNPKRGR